MSYLEELEYIQSKHKINTDSEQLNPYKKEFKTDLAFSMLLPWCMLFPASRPSA